MIRATRIPVFILTLLFLSAPAFAADRPNIIWIYADDHAVNAVSAYGGRLAEVAPTPHIDRIANEGILFRNSFVTNSICGPCRAVILTGLHSHLNGFRQNGDNFDGSQRTFVKLLKTAGYQTAIFGKWHLRSNPEGFDAWEVLPGQGHYYNPTFLTADGRHDVEGYVTDVVTDKALNWLENDRQSDEPFMLMVQHKAPHREWEPGPDHLTLFDDVTIPEPDNLFDDYANRASAAKLQDMSIEKTMRMGSDLKVWTEEDYETGPYKRTFARMTDAQRKAWDAAYEPKNKAFLEAKLEGKELISWKYQRYLKDYLRCIRAIDDNVGRLLAYLDESGLAENTIVFYSADQGFYLGEHGWFDKRFIYEESLRTPLVARWPGVVEPGSNTDAIVQNLDVAQSFLEIAGVAPPEDMQGISFVPLMKGDPPVGWRDGIYYHYYEGEGKVHNVYKHYGVRTARYTLAYYYTLDEWELFDLLKDPTQMNNLYDDPAYAGEVERLKLQLATLRKNYKVPENNGEPN